MLSPQSITAIQQHITNNNRYIGKKPDIKVYDHLWQFLPDQIDLNNLLFSYRFARWNVNI